MTGTPGVRGQAPRPMPEGLPEYLRDNSRKAAAAHFGVHKSMIERWIERMSEADRAIVHSGASLRRPGYRKGTGKKYEPKRGRLKRPMPDDFFDVLMAVGAHGASRHYKAGKDSMARWKAALTERQRAQYEYRAKELALEGARRGLVARVASGRLGGRPRVEKPPAEPKPRKGYRWNNRIPGSDYVPAPSGPLVAALNHLRRFYTPVFDAGKVYGKALNGVYVAGRLRLNATELLQLAAKHGYDADEWRRLAA